MKPILILLFLGTAFLVQVAAQETGDRTSQTAASTIHRTPAQVQAIKELNEGARSYRQGNFAEAQQHFEKALALDPSSMNAISFIARAIRSQYGPGDKNEANLAKAREAIDAYKRVLARDPQHEEAYRAVVYFYNALKEDELLRQWVLQRALDPNSSQDKRADAFIVLASKAWDCSFKITELPLNKTTSIPRRGGRIRIRYSKPHDLGEFEKAQQCASGGLEMIEAAITLTPDSEPAWSYKTNLLLEMAKLAEMNQDLQLKTEYTRQSEAARQRTEEIMNMKADKSPSKP